MAEEIRVIAVNNVLGPSGERRIGVQFGIPYRYPPKILPKEQVMTTIQVAPGMSAPLPQKPIENKAIIYFTEEEWENLKEKPTVDSKYELITDTGGKIVFEKIK